LEAHDFRVCFTPLAGVLFTVPSRYCTLSVAACSSPWTVVSPASDQVLRAWPYSGTAPGTGEDAYGTITRYGAVFQTASAILIGSCEAHQRLVYCPTTPVRQRLAPWHRTGLGIARFVRHYYGCGSLFLRLLRCFSWPGALGQRPYPHRGELPHSETPGSQPVSGSPRHIGAVPRPSSARSARASIVCSSCLPYPLTLGGSGAGETQSIVITYAVGKVHPWVKMRHLAEQ
jgi:hypothetical protein